MVRMLCYKALVPTLLLSAPKFDYLYCHREVFVLHAYIMYTSLSDEKIRASKEMYSNSPFYSLGTKKVEQLSSTGMFSKARA